MKGNLRWAVIGMSLCLVSFHAVAQVRDSLLVAAENYMETYDYEQALRCFNQAEYYVADSLGAVEIAEQIRHCDTLLAISRTVPVLNVISRARFSKEDFFLYYPFPDKSFRPVDGGGVIYYTGPEDNLFINRDEAEGQFLSVTAGDCKYFSKKSEDGFGGYDLYCSRWNSVLGEWGEARNLGFPYSSSGNDYLYMETEDGKFSLFASDRSCGADSVYVYVIDNSVKPQYASVSSGEARAQLAELFPNVDNSTLVRSSSDPEASDLWMDRYQELAEREMELRLLMLTASGEQMDLFQKELDEIVQEKIRVEEVIFETNSKTRTISEEVDRDVAGVDGAFIFIKKSLGAPIKINLT